MNLLLIEDNRAIATAYSRILESANHTCDIAANPLVGISKALRNSYDLILVDLMLPEINGAELVERLRKEGCETNIVVLTNMGSGYDMDALNKLGVKEVLLKSKVGPAELRELVRRYDHK